MEFEFYISQCTFISLIHLIVNLESIGAATGVSHRHPMRPDVGCGGQHRTHASELLLFFSLFFFFVFGFTLTCVDSGQFAPTCTDLGQLLVDLHWLGADSGQFVPNRADLCWIDSYRPTETDQFKSIPALNKAEIQVRIIKKKKPKTIIASLCLSLLSASLCSLHSNFNVLVSNLWIVFNLWTSCLSYHLLLLLNLVYVYIMWKSMLSNM